MTLYLIIAALTGAGVGVGGLVLAARKSDRVLTLLGGGGPRPVEPRR